MKPLVIAISVIVSIIAVIGLIFIVKKQQAIANVTDYPSNVDLSTIEEYVNRNFRVRPITLNYPTSVYSVLLVPSFVTTYYDSNYYDLCDIKENCITAIYLTTIGNINLSSRILNSIIYIMISSGWVPTGQPAARIQNYTGLPRYYNMNPTGSATVVSLQQIYSDVASLYLSIALCKFLLTFDSQIKSLSTYNKIINTYTFAAFDLVNFILTTQACPGTGYFYAYRFTDTTAVSLYSTFHILLYTACNFLSQLNTKYNMQINPQVFTNAQAICTKFLTQATPNIQNGDTIQYNFYNCSLTPVPPSGGPVQGSYTGMNQTVTEDYLVLLLTNYYPVSNLSQTIVVEKILSTFYNADTDYTPFGCGAGVIDNSGNPIPCNAKNIPSSHIFYGVKWSKGSQATSFAFSAFTLYTFMLINQISNYTGPLFNLKLSLLKIYQQYNTAGILGGFQEELAFPNDPLNTGTGQSTFRYLSLLATIYTGFALLFMKYGDTKLNFLLPNSTIYPVTTSQLGFDNSVLFTYL